MQEEIWKPVVGFEGLYEVSNLGRVRSLNRIVVDKNMRAVFHKGKVLSLRNNGGYYAVILTPKEGRRVNRTVHRLVGFAFIPNPENKPEIDHIDGNPRNNKVDNLHWVTHKENSCMPIRRANMSKAKMGAGSGFYGKRNLEVKNSKPVLQIDKAGNIVKAYPSAMEAYRQTGIYRNTISNVASGGKIKGPQGIYPAKTAGGFKWKYITREEYAEYAKNV